MRRPIAILAALVLLAAIPAAVSAKRPTQFTDHFVGIFCDGIAATTGDGFLFLGVAISDEFGPDAGLDMWHSSSPVGPPDIFRDFDSPVDGSYVGGTFNASIPLVDLNGDPAGTGIVSATLEPAGDPFTIEDAFKDGNANIRFTQTTQPLSASGTALIDGTTFDLAGCFAEDTTITEWRTSPNSFVFRFDTAMTNCNVTNGDGSTASVFIDASSNDVFVDAFVESGPGSPVVGFGVVTLTDGSGSGTLELFNPETGEPVAGSGTVDLSLTEGEGYRYVLTDSAGKSVVRGTLIDVEGTLTLPGTAPFDLASCVSFVGTEKGIFHNQQGPKPRGKVPANDLPSGAKLLTVGSKTSQSTRAASPDREASYSCLTFEDPPGEIFEIPVGNTVWFQIQGTGSDVTVDTAGSDFDTVAAAYVSDGSGGFTEVACVDDVPLDPFGRTLQAAITFPTEIGTTYYVQIGGFPSLTSYGNLRVAVR